MALTPTTSIALGFKAPDFSLPDTVSGETMSLEKLQSAKCTIVMFICNHCPYVIHVMDELVRLAKDYIPKGVSFIAISSNDAENYPQDSPANMKEFASAYQFPFPYLYDESQEVAKAYDAACTPDFDVFDGDMNCVYRGRLDGSRPGNSVPVNGEDMRMALNAILKGEKPYANQQPSVGCNIKWK